MADYFYSLELLVFDGWAHDLSACSYRKILNAVLEVADEENQ